MPLASEDASQHASTGDVLGVNMGIVSIDGLRSAHVGACIEFFSRASPAQVSAIGLVLSIHADFARAIIIGSGEESVEVGQHARHTRGHVPAVEIEKIDSWQGQVIDPLGRLLDQNTLAPIVARPPKPILLPLKGSHASSAPTALPVLTLPPPPLSSRSTTHAFLPTGFVHIDVFHPLAEGLRIGVMGPRRTGKSALAAAFLGSFARQAKDQWEANQSKETKEHATEAESTEQVGTLPSPFHFIYVSVGQSRSDVRALLDRLQRNGSMAHTTVIVATDQSGMGLQYLAPFMGQTIADHYRSIGESSFTVFDDLSAHGQVLTTINRAFGYPLLAPNFVHAQLLERTAPLHSGASSTCLVLGETHRPDRPLEVNENLSGFVDHAIWLDANLAAKGAFPAVNVASVLGRPAARYRPHVLRSLSNTLSTQILQSDRSFNTARWAKEFGLEVEEDDRPMMELKEKVQAVMTQGLDEPLYSVTDQVILLYALLHSDRPGVSGDTTMQQNQVDTTVPPLSRISLENVRTYAHELLRAFRVPSPVDPDGAQLYAEVDREVKSKVAREGNSTAAVLASERGRQKQEGRVEEKDEGVFQKADNASASTSSTGSSIPYSPELWSRVDVMLARFNEAFIRKYER